MPKVNRVRSKRLQVWMRPALHGRVTTKANQESVNLSALLRSFLEDWLEGEWPSVRKGENRDDRTDVG